MQCIIYPPLSYNGYGILNMAQLFGASVTAAFWVKSFSCTVSYHLMYESYFLILIQSGVVF